MHFFIIYLYVYFEIPPLYSTRWPRTHNIEQGVLELVVIVTLPPECWDHS